MPDITATYTTLDLANGAVTSKFDGGTLTAASTTAVSNDFTVGSGGGTVNTNGKTLTATGTVADAGTTAGALTVTGGGTLILSGNNSYSGGTVVNGGTLQLNTTTAAGTGAIRTVDPTVVFNAQGAYANAITLASTDTTNDPTILQNTSGGIVTLNGAITEASAGQPLQFTGNNGTTFAVTNTANSWSGQTTVAAATTLQGNNQTISGSNVVNNGTLAFVQAGNGGTFTPAISGVGVTKVSGVGAGNVLTFSGAVGNNGGLVILDASAVTLSSGGSATNGPVVAAQVAGATVTNLGTITFGGSTGGISLVATGTAINGSMTNATASINGGYAGIYSTAGLLTAINYGVLSDGYGVVSQGGGNGASLNLTNSGTITGNDVAVVANETATSDIIVNSGKIVGLNGGIVSAGTTTTLTNSGTIATGTLNGSGVVAVAGTNFAVKIVSGSITNAGSGILQSAGAAINQTSTSGMLNLVNAGTIGGLPIVGQPHTNPDDTVVARGSASIFNSGTISTPNYFAVTMLNGGTLINAASGQITAGTAGNRYAVDTANAASTISNYGMLTSTGNATSNSAGVNDSVSRGIVTDNNAATIFLYAGSTTGAIATGSGNDALTLYTGTGTANGGLLYNTVTGATSTGSVPGTNQVVLQAAGVNNAAVLAATVNLGSTSNGEINTLTLAGSGTDAAGTMNSVNGVMGMLDVSKISGVTNLVKQDSGTWTLTGGGNTYAVGTQVQAGRLIIQNQQLATGTTNIASNAFLELNQSGGLTYEDGVLVTGAGTLVKSGAGTTALRGEVRMSAGGLIDVQGGILDATSDAQGIFTANLAGLNVSSGAQFNLIEHNAQVGALSSVNSGGGTGAAIVGGGFGGATSTLTIGAGGGGGSFGGVLQNNAGFVGPSGPSAPINGVLAIAKVGSGIQTLTGANTYTGATTISGGTLALSGTGTIATSSSLADNAVFDISGLTNGGTTVNALTGNGIVALGGNKLTLATAGTIATSFVDAGIATGSGGKVTLSGAGTYTFTNTGNTYTGATTINSGATLLVTAPGQLAAMSAIVDNGLLQINSAGNPTIANAVSGAGTVQISANAVLTGALTNNVGVNVDAGVTAGVGSVTATDINGVLLGTGATVTVAGTVSSGAYGVEVDTGGTVNVLQNGIVYGSLNGNQAIYSGASIIIDNAGTIQSRVSGNSAIIFGGAQVAGQTSTITNEATGQIIGLAQGINATSLNAGTLNVVNIAGGQISGTTNGIGSVTTTGVNNAGTVTGGTYGVTVTGALGLTNSGIISGGTVGVYDVGALGTIAAAATNSGTIVGSTGVQATATSYLTNSGTIASGTYNAANTPAITLANGTAVALTGGTIGNTGAILAGSSNGVGVSASGVLILTNSGDIAGYRGITSTSTATTNSVANTGRILTGTLAGNAQGGAATIAGTNAVQFAAGTITNGSAVNATALVQGQSDGIYGNGSGTVNVNNFATIRANDYAAIELTQAGTVHNYAGGSIVGGTRNNSATDTGTGVRFASGSGTNTLFNDANATLVATGAATNIAVYATGAAMLSLTNGGTIVGSANGLDAVGSAVIVNTGLIGAGALANGTSGAFTGNGNGNVAVAIAGGTVTNGGSGQIGGALVSTAALTLSNAGMMNAVTVTGAGNSAVTLRSGSTTGAVTLGGGDDSVVIYTGTGAGFAGVASSYVAAGVHNRASVSSLDLGTGTNTVTLAGGGTEAAAGSTVTGQQGTFALNTVTGLSTLIKTGSGNWTLSGAATGTTAAAAIYAGNKTDTTATGILAFNGTTGLTGAIFVNGATVQVSGDAALGVGVVHMVDPTVTFVTNSTNANAILLEVGTGSTGGDPTTFNANAGVTGTLTGQITTGSGTNIDGVAIDANQPVVIGGAGVVSLANTANSWTGTTTINAGATLRGTSVGAISGSSIIDNGTLNYTGALAAGTVAQAISGGGVVTIDGGATVTLAGANTYTGLTTVAGAGSILTLSGGSAIADTGAVQIGNGATLALAASETIASLNALTGQAGDGTAQVTLGATTLTLGGDNSNSAFAGVISGVGGNLTKTGSGILTLSGPNTFTGTLDVAGGTLSYGANDVLADTATVQVNSGATFDLHGFSDTIGTLNLYGTLSNGGLLTATTYNAYQGSVINQAIGGTGTLNIFGNTTLNSATTAAPVNIYTGALSTGSADLLSDTGAINIASGGSLSLGGKETIGSLSDLAFGMTTTGGTVVLGGGVLTVGNAADTGFSGSISGNATGNGLIKVGTGTLTLSGINSYNGTTTVNGGTLALSSGAALADADVVTVNTGGTLALNTSETIGSLVGAGAVALNSGTVLTLGAAAGTFTGGIAGAGGVTLAAGTETLSGTNAYTGATTIGGGTLKLTGTGSIAGSSVADNAMFDVSGLTAGTNIVSLSGVGVVTLGANTLTLTNAADNFAGAIGGTGGLTLTAGTETLSGTNGYTGATTINGGTLKLTGTGSIAGSSVADNATFDVSGLTAGTSIVSLSGNGVVTLGANTLTLTNAADNFAGAIGGTGGLTLTAGAQTLSGSNGYTGATTINGGTLTVSGGTALADGDAVTVNTGGTLALATSETIGTSQGAGAVTLNGGTILTLAAAAGTYAGAMNGMGGLTLGAGAETLSGTNGYTGATTINGGTLTVSGGNALADTNVVTVNGTGTLALATSETIGNIQGAGAVTLTGGTVLSVAAGAGTYAGVMSGAGGFTLAGGALTLSGANAYTGTTTVSGGTLQGTSNSIAGSTIVDNATLAYNQTASGTVAQPITGSGVVTVTGLAAGNALTFAGANAQTGGFQVADASVVAFTGTNGGAATEVTLQGAGTLVNTGTITGTATGIAATATGGTATVSNASAGTIAGASFGVQSSGAGALALTNYGTITGPVSALSTGANMLALRAGSMTGAVTTGAGNDTLTLYTGIVTTAATVDATTGLTLRPAGTYAAASVGAIDLGTGTNLLNLRGAGDGTTANGAAATIGLNTVSNVGSITKQDAGTWTLTGAATTSVANATINAGVGGTPGSGGLLIFSGTGLTGAIVVNGATIRATTGTAFGTGTIYEVDPTTQFAATATYANNFVLQSANPASDPTLFQTVGAGVVATLSGSIKQAAGVAAQPLVFGSIAANGTASTGTFVLTNTGNAWNGVTTVNAGTTLRGTTATLSGASFTDNGVLNFNQAAAGTSARAISGSGTVLIDGGGPVTLTGAITGSGGVQVGANTTATLSNVSGSNGNAVTFVGSGGVLNVANGGSVGSTNGNAVFSTVTGNTINNAGTLAGNANNGAISLQAAGGTDTIANAAGATITGYQAIYSGSTLTLTNAGTLTGQVAQAVLAGGAGSSVVNAGTITGGTASTTTSAISLTGGGTVTNNAGTIIGNRGVNITGATGTVTNYAQITGRTTSAVTLGVGGNVTNYAGGTITATTAGSYGVYTAGTGTIENQGIVSADNGLVSASSTTMFTNEGTITAAQNGVWGYGTSVNLTNTGMITGGGATGTAGVRAEAAGSSITNSGTIAASSTAGVAVYMTGGTLTNQSGGTISGGMVAGGGYGTAIQLVGTGNMLSLAAGSTVNGRIDASGTTDGSNGYTFSGNLNGGFTGGSGNDTVTLLTPVTVTGTLDGGAGTDTLVLDGTTAGTLGSAQVVNFENGVKQGSGTWTLTGTTAASPTSFAINAGTLAVAGGNALADNGAVAIASGATLQLNASETIGSLAGAGNVTLGANTLTTGGLNASPTFSGVASGTGGLTKVGTGTLTLAGTNTYTGATTVSAGTLALAATNAIGAGSAVTVASGATLNLATYHDTVASLALNGTLAGTGTLTAATYTLNGAVVNANLGAGTLTQAGGTSVLNGTAGAATVNITGGTLSLSANDRLADNAALTVASGATLNMGAFTDTVGTAALNGTLAGTGTLTAATYTLNGATVNGNLGAGTLTQAGGTSVLSGTAGAATVNVSGGTLALGASDRLADNATVTIANGAILDLGANTDTVGLAQIAGTLNGTGTLTAVEYDLAGATVNANLGAGNLFQQAGISTLNGTSNAANVMVTGGTLLLGASNRLADNAAVGVATGATLNLGANTDTVGTLTLNGTLAGTGTLTAASYTLNNAAVNANLGTGTLVQASGTSVLAGTAATNVVAVMAGTLRLGASDRIADGAMLGVASGATFDLAGYNETVGTLAGTGTLALGAGTLAAGGTNADYAFGGNVTGAGDLTKIGTGTFSLIGNAATTGRLNVNAGTLMLAGTTAGSVRVQGGTLTGASAIAGNLLLSSGTLSPGIATQPVAMIQAGSLTVTGGTTVFDFGGMASGFTADLLKITGAATLSGGMVTTRSLDPSASYKMVQTYTVVQAGSLTGTYASGATFTQVSNNADLYYRLRYDLVANGVVLEIRKPVDFTTTLGAGATGNQLAVASALNGGVLTGSDAYASALNAIAQLSPDQRRATLDNIGGESTADISTSVALIGDRFNELLRHRVAVGGAGNSADPSLIAGIAGGKRGLDQVRAGGQIGAEGSSFADGSRDNHAGAWVQTFGGAGRLDGSNGTARVTDQSYGVAAGIDAKVAGLSIGGAFAASALDTRVEGRSATNRGTLYQGGGYVAYDDGLAYASAVGSYFSGDVNSSRQVYVGAAFQGNATGTARVTGYTAGGAAGYRLPVGGGVRFTPQVSVQATHVDRDAFTETGAGVLSLAVGKDVRNLYTATVEGRLSHVSAAPGGIIEPYAGAGVAFAFGDLNAVSANRFSGAPTGTGAFQIAGARLSPTTALINGGIEAHPNDRVTLGMGVETRLSNRERDGRVELHVRLGF